MVSWQVDYGRVAVVRYPVTRRSLAGLDVSHSIARVDGRTGPAARRALANADARAHRATERPGHRLHLQLPDGPWSHDQRDGHRLPDSDYDDLGTRQGGQVLGRRAEH